MRFGSVFIQTCFRTCFGNISSVRSFWAPLKKIFRNFHDHHRRGPTHDFFLAFVCFSPTFSGVFWLFLAFSGFFWPLSGLRLAVSGFFWPSLAFSGLASSFVFAPASLCFFSLCSLFSLVKMSVFLYYLEQSVISGWRSGLLGFVEGSLRLSIMKLVLVLTFGK